MVSSVVVVRAFLPDAWAPRTFRELRAAASITSNNGLQQALRRMMEDGLLGRRRVGSTYLYSLLPRPGTYSLLEQASHDALRRRGVLRDVERVIDAAHKRLGFFSVVVFGSFAKGTYTKSSDLDLAIIVPAASHQEPFLRKDLSLSAIRTIDLHLISSSELRKMLVAPYENLGKQMLGASLPVKDAETFYSLVGTGAVDAVTLSRTGHQ